ncbi:MAG: glycosyltransferase family 2 protein [Candidatus Lustribacter sp.]|jgi:hypothetical protein
MISPFGKLASQYAQGLGEIDAIVTEPHDLPRAFLEAVARRERGLPFYGMLLMEEQRAHVIAAISNAILQHHAGYDERRYEFENLSAGRLQVNGRPSSELFTSIDPATAQIAGEFFSLCNAVLVRSYAEYARQQSLMIRPRPFEVVVHEPRIPAAPRSRPQQPGIVVWGADRPSSDLGAVALALSDFYGDVVFVSSDGAALDALAVTALLPDDPRVAAALATASCVLTTQTADPGYAIAFARRGYGILAPQAAGVEEYVREAVPYDPGSVRSIRIGAALAIARPASLRRLPDPPPPLRLPAPPVAVGESQPLVSIVVPTYNRPAELRNCLGCIGAQTYSNLEAVVVNDAGQPVDDVVAEFPFARLITLGQNGGCYTAMREGWEQSRGAFVQFLADDDWLFPDNTQRLVSALLASGAAIAHGNGLIRIQERNDAGAFETSGFNAKVFNDSATPADALISTPIAGHSLMWRRDVFEEIGFWRPDITIADQEVQLRAAQKYVFAFVDQVTVEWRIRGESSFKADSAAEMRKIFDELHPAPGRPLLRQMREAAVANVTAMYEHSKGGPIFPATISVRRGVKS